MYDVIIIIHVLSNIPGFGRGTGLLGGGRLDMSRNIDSFWLSIKWL